MKVDSVLFNWHFTDCRYVTGIWDLMAIKPHMCRTEPNDSPVYAVCSCDGLDLARRRTALRTPRQLFSVP